MFIVTALQKESKDSFEVCGVLAPQKPLFDMR